MESFKISSGEGGHTSQGDALLLGRLGGCVLQRLQFLLFVKKLGIEVKDLSLTSTE